MAPHRQPVAWHSTVGEVATYARAASGRRMVEHVAARPRSCAMSRRGKTATLQISMKPPFTAFHPAQIRSIARSTRAKANSHDERAATVAATSRGGGAAAGDTPAWSELEDFFYSMDRSELLLLLGKAWKSDVRRSPTA
eukprot:scaffold26257_cov63-Phaeocystis_antarctica.AAC.3